MNQESASRRIWSPQTLSSLVAIVVALSAVLVLIGWLFEIEFLKISLPATAAMKGSTALCFVIAGVSLWTLTAEQAGPFRRHLGQAGAAVVALLGLFAVSDYLFGWAITYDQILFGESAAGPFHSSQIQPATAVNLVIVGIALNLLSRRRGFWPAHWLALLVGAASVLVLIGYAYGVPALYRGSRYTEMSLHAATAFLLLSTGVLLARPSQAFMAPLLSPSAGGIMARRLLPAAIAIPVVLGWLRLLGQRAGLYEQEFGVSLSAVSTILLFTALIWWNACSLNAKDERQRRAEEAVQASEEKFRSVAQTAKEAIVSADSQGVVTYFNAGAELMFGFSAHEIIGKPLALLMPKDFSDPDQCGVRRVLDSVQRKCRGQTIESIGRRSDGTPFPLELSLSDWRTPDGLFFTSIIRDITRRKAAEGAVKSLNEDLLERTAQLEVVNRELHSFAYSLSHDLRGPVRAIKGFTVILAKEFAEQLGAEGREFLGRVLAATHRMEQLIHSMLALSQVTQAELRRTSVNMSEMAETLLTDLRQTQPDRHVSVTIAPDQVVNADANLLRIALENLLSNAWKYTGKQPDARIEVGGVCDNGETLYFVRDNGAGFDMAYAGKLFGPFQRLHRSSEFEGNGVGLATVQRVILRHGGRVWAESKPDKGATFYFTLPSNDTATIEA